MFPNNMNKYFKQTSSVYLALLVTVCVLLNEVCLNEAAPSPSAAAAAHNLSKLKAKFYLKKRAHFEPIFDEVNRCILACGKCSEDLYSNDDKEDPEQSRGIMCANECLAPKPTNKDPNEVLVLNLLSNELFDKTFVKCFISQSLNPDYSYD